MTTLLLNELRAVSVKRVVPWRGVWTLDADFDLDVPVAPTGPAVVKIGDTGLLRGTVDERAGGRFGEKGHSRVLAGGGGWDQPVVSRQFHNDAGVLSTNVLTATALEVGEQLVQAVPSRLGVDFVRSAGPASRVLSGVDWYVNAQGITIVGPRIPYPAPPTVEVLEWNPLERRAEIACDELVEPGMLLVDARFGTVMVRDVEQTWSESGARATAWCTSETTPAKGVGSRLGAALRSLVREQAGVTYLKTYRYRIVSQSPIDGRLTLQSVKRSAEVPDLVMISVWPGMAGLSAKFKPGTEVLVEFLDETTPIVRGFAGGAPPIELTLDATLVKVGLGTSPAAVATLVTLQLEALKAAIEAALIVPTDGGASFKSTLLAQLAAWPASVASTNLMTEP